MDPLGHLDLRDQDVWICDGRIVAIFRHIGDEMAPVVDVTPKHGQEPIVLCPGFIDLHAHLREPGDDDSESIMSGAAAAAAGGFTHLVAMADTDPIIDTPRSVADSCFRAVATRVQILNAAALTKGQRGDELVDLRGCFEAGAVAFSDDPAPSVDAITLARALAQTVQIDRVILVNPIGIAGLQVNHELAAQAEVTVIRNAMRALRSVKEGRIHIQHLSTRQGVELVRSAKEEGLGLTAEVSPLHLSMWSPLAEPLTPPSLSLLMPPLQTERDRIALIGGLRDGTIDALVSDHSPVPLWRKRGDDPPPGAVGLETALATAITIGGMGGDWIPTLVGSLTEGPFHVLGEAVGLSEPRLRIGEAATCVVFDPNSEVGVDPDRFRSQSRNTPLGGLPLKGRVLLTIVDGAVVHHDSDHLNVTASGSEE